MFRINPQFNDVRESRREELLKLCRTNIGDLHPCQCAHYFDDAGNVCIESLGGMDDIRFYCWRLIVDKIVNKHGKRWTFRDAGDKIPTSPFEIFK